MNFQNCNENAEIFLESLLIFVNYCSITVLLLYYRAQSVTWQYFLKVVVLLFVLTFPVRHFSSHTLLADKILPPAVKHFILGFMKSPCPEKFSVIYRVKILLQFILIPYCNEKHSCQCLILMKFFSFH